MEEVQRHFDALEAVTNNIKVIEDVLSDDTQLHNMVKTFEKTFNISFCELYKEESLQRHLISVRDYSNEHLIVTHFLFYSLLAAKNVDSGQFTGRQCQVYSTSLFRSAQLALLPALDDRVVNEPLLGPISLNVRRLGEGINDHMLLAHISVINELLQCKHITPQCLEEIIILQLSGILSGLIRDEKRFLKHLDLFSGIIFKEKFFKYILLFKGNKKLPKRLHILLHEFMLRSLQQKGGLSILFGDVAAKQENPNFWKHCDVLARILAHDAHSEKFTICMIDQLHDRIQEHVRGTDDECWLKICINCLLKIKRSDLVAAKFLRSFIQLSSPQDLLTGYVVMESDELKLQLLIIKAAFYQIPGIYLPYEMLLSIVPILYELRQRLLESDEIFFLLTNIITKVIRDQLNDGQDSLIGVLLLGVASPAEEFYHLHPRLMVKYNECKTRATLVIAGTDENNFERETSHFVKFLSDCDNNLLIEKVFLNLLAKVAKYYEDDDGTDSPSNFVACDLDELEAIVGEKFGQQFCVISTLTGLIYLKTSRGKFNPNPREVISFVNQMVQLLLKRSTPAPMLVNIILSLVSEICDSKFRYELRGELITSLNLLNTAIEDPLVQSHIKDLIQYLNTGVSVRREICNQFEQARMNWEQNEPYMKAYGMKQMLKLLEDNHTNVSMQKHTILAMALDTLKNDDSFAFLNAINLLVCLTSYLEAEVIEALIADYQNEAIDVDLRLKHGEAIVKVAEKLGPLAFKYKDLLFDCFLRGSSNSINEYRVSSLANLGTLCRLLAYQAHNFFYELVCLLESILLNDKHIPARRGAALVLDEFLKGFDGLADFEEFLLPIYRLVKDLATFDDDYQVTLHASNATECLRAKVMQFLKPESSSDVKIRILDIRKPQISIKSPYTFEIN